MKAWHFTGDKLRDGSAIPKPGVTLFHTGPLVMCRSGFHASKRAIDALSYAPGYMIHRVELSGKMIHDNDKTVARERTILWSVNGEVLLRDFARRCALDVIHLWDAPEIVARYLKTGDETIRDAAGDAAGAAAWAAAEAAARAAARAAAGDAARAWQLTRLRDYLEGRAQ